MQPLLSYMDTSLPACVSIMAGRMVQNACILVLSGQPREDLSCVFSLQSASEHQLQLCCADMSLPQNLDDEEAMHQRTRARMPLNHVSLDELDALLGREDEGLFDEEGEQYQQFLRVNKLSQQAVFTCTDVADRKRNKFRIERMQALLPDADQALTPTCRLLMVTSCQLLATGDSEEFRTATAKRTKWFIWAQKLLPKD